MIKVELKNRTNLTLLSLSFIDGLFPRAKKGELFYEKDLANETINVFFEENYYHNKLLPYINGYEIQNKIEKSNNSENWLKLIQTLNGGINFKNYQIENLEIYSMTDDNFDDIIEDKNIIQEVLSCLPKDDRILSLKLDLRKIYPSLDFDTFKSKEGIKITFFLYMKNEVKFNFNFETIFKIVMKYNYTVENIKIYKGENLNCMHTEITLN